MFRPNFRPVFDLPDWNFLCDLVELVAAGELSETSAARALVAERRRLHRLNVVELRTRRERGRGMAP